MAKQIEMDFAYDEDDLAEALVRAFQDYDVTYKIVNLHGPGGGWPVLRIRGKRAELERVLREVYQLPEDEITDDYLTV